MSQQWVRTGKGAATVKVQTTTLELCITNCGPHARKNVLEKQLVDGGVMNISYVDKPKNSVTAFVGFPSVTDRDAGIRSIACLTSKSDKKYSVKLSTRRVPEHILNGTQDPSVKTSDAQISRKPAVPMPGSANESTAPWLQVPYSDQLRRKEAEIDASLRSVCSGLIKHCTRAGEESRTEAGVGMKRPRPADDEEDEEHPKQNHEDEQGEENEADKQDEGEGRGMGTAAQGTSSWAQDVRLPSWLRQLMQSHAASPSASPSPSPSSAAVGNMPLPCPLHPIIPSPVLTGYRNKASLTCGRDAHGVPTVGFRLGAYGQTNAVDFPPTDQPLLPHQMLEVAGMVQEWMRGSTLPPYDIESHEGVWRAVTLRWAAGTGGCTGGEMMVGLTAAPPSQKNEGAQLNTSAVVGEDVTTAGQEMYRAELERLRALLCTGIPSHTATPSSTSSSSPQWKVTSLHIQEYHGRSIPDVNQHPFKLLWSAQPESGGTLVETLCGMRFEVSPSAFFQVNTRAAEVLYSTARLLALDGQQGMQQVVTLLGGRDAGVCAFEALLSHQPPQRLTTALVDVCCGTGTIGLCMASYVGRVVGVEVNADAVSDAARNATLNAVSNAVFVAQKAETAMKDILSIAEKGSSTSGSAAGSAATPPSTTAVPGSSAPSIAHVVAIVDPPRGGLHPAVILALRTCKALKRLVYVSCNPGLGGSFVEDAVKLMAPQEGSRKSAYARGPAFRLACAVPVDLFPHTPHTELVALFERD